MATATNRILIATILGIVVGTGINTVARYRAEQQQLEWSRQNNTLFQNMPLPMLWRMVQLWHMGYVSCEEISKECLEELKKHQMEGLAHFCTEDKNFYLVETGKANCHATAYWVVTGKRSDFAVDPDIMISLLGRAGYRKALEVFPFRTQDGRIVGIDKGKLNKLKAGDVLVFSRIRKNPKGYGEDLTPYKHSAVYVGKHEGEHFMFQKRGRGCGPDFPFELLLIEEILSLRLHKEIDARHDMNFGKICVWRR